MSSSNPKRNDRQGRSERRSDVSGKDAVRQPETSRGSTGLNQPFDDPIRSPDSTKNAFFENDYLNGE